MTLVVSVADLRDALAFDDIDDVNVAIEQAIEQAQQSVADTIRSSIARATVIDEFWVGSVNTYAGSNPQTELLLSQGFVDSGQTYTVYAAGSQTNLSSSSNRTDVRAQNGVDHVVLDAEEGLIRIVDWDLTRCYVRISYTAGFADNSGSPAIYTGTPEWLKQAVRLKAQLILDANPVLPRPTERFGEGGASTGATVIGKTLSTITLNHSRYVPGSWKPYRTTPTPV